MSQRQRMLTIGLIAFLLVSIITTATTFYYHQEYLSANQKYLLAQNNYASIRESVIEVSVTVDYGNGTSIMEGSVYLTPNSTALDALQAVAEVNASYWEMFQSFFINAVNNVFNDQDGNGRWWVFSVNGEHALVSADHYPLEDGDDVDWIYQQY